MKPKILYIVILLFVTLHAATGYATTRFDVTGPRPVPDNGVFFRTLESKTLAQLQWSLGTSADYGYRPLGARLGTARIDIVRRQLVEHFYGAFGITDWLNLSFDMPVIWYNRFINPDTISAARNELGIGDLGVAMKFRILDRGKLPVGLAISPFVTFPTGKDRYFMGEDGFTGGGKLILDGDITKWVTWSINAGGLARKHFNAYGINFDEQLLLSGGVAVNAARFLTVSGEVEARTPFGDLFKKKDTTPTEGRAGLKWFLGKDRNFILTTAAGLGLNYGSGTPRYRVLAGFTYVQPERVKKPKLDRLGVKKAVEKVVYFRFGSARVTPEASAVLGGVGRVLVENTWIGRVLLRGCTDNIGSKTVNFRLGERRANAVKGYLQSLGVAPERMEIMSCGEGKPAQPNTTRENRAENRRVEITIVE